MSLSLSSKQAVKLRRLFPARTSFAAMIKLHAVIQSTCSTNDLGAVHYRQCYKHFSLINEIKVVYLTDSFLIVHIEVRYSPLYYGLLIQVNEFISTTDGTKLVSFYYAAVFI